MDPGLESKILLELSDLLTQKMQIPKHIVALIIAIACIAPSAAKGILNTEPYEQEFIITAYYSPLPKQCCYIKGGLEADRILNGEGHTGADGTAVYPGMLAAPPSYAFGTRIALPGIGILTVHDRGGAIQELEESHRLDVWAGYGEEGLARALAFGVQRVKGTVYPNGSDQPEESINLDDLPAPPDQIENFLMRRDNLVGVETKLEDTNLSAALLQETLKELGYFRKTPTGYFGEETQASLAQFLTDFQVNEPSDRLTERTAAYLLAAKRRLGAPSPVSGYVDDGASPKIISEAQRILRFFGYYRGRTSGEYDDNLFASILRFQQDNWLVGTENDPGAGRIGPLTSLKLDARWNRSLTTKRAELYLALHQIDQVLTDRGKHIDRFLEEGQYGNQVKLLQTLLADRGFFPEEKINGSFGPLTKKAVISYQLANELITSASNEGAGFVGPQTMQQLRKEERKKLYTLVRSEGWSVL